MFRAAQLHSTARSKDLVGRLFGRLLVPALLRQLGLQEAKQCNRDESLPSNNPSRLHGHGKHFGIHERRCAPRSSRTFKNSSLLRPRAAERGDDVRASGDPEENAG